MALDKWTFLESEADTPQANMARDQQLLKELSPESAPVLHLYAWNCPSATYGYFIEPSSYIDLEAAARHGVQLARRPTGGGLIFHMTDLAFSVLIPARHPGYSLNVMENYAFVNYRVAEVIRRFLNLATSPWLLQDNLSCTSLCSPFCMAKPTRYDVIWEGKKVGGGAQRRMRQGFLHQGSIALAMPPTPLLDDLLGTSSSVIEAMKTQSFYLLGAIASAEQLEKARRVLRQLLVSVFCGQEQIDFAKMAPTSR